MRFSIESSRRDSLFLRALACQNRSSRPPVWIMRQAGRYLPEYQSLRKKHSLEALFRNPELIAEITLQPLRRFALDAAIVFADILHVLLPLGCRVTFPDTGGPVVSYDGVLREKEVVTTLHFVKEGIKLVKESLRVPLIGFCGGPFTVAYYLLNKKPERLMYGDPSGFGALLQAIARVSRDYLRMQVSAGVDAIQIFDSWAGRLSRKELTEFVLPALKELVDAVEVPVLLFSKGISFHIETFLQAGATALSLDAGRPLAEMRREIPPSVSVQGNLPPAFLYGSKEKIREETGRHIASMRRPDGTLDPGFIVNLGHGVLPDTPHSHVGAFINAVHDTAPSATGTGIS
ncbi:MAG: uroporphyrinogen decarboxylase [Simkaniaceae bacterium]|nr:uroporphyrinogen decarboxylase [Simkaniaceae bacterium]